MKVVEGLALLSTVAVANLLLMPAETKNTTICTNLPPNLVQQQFGIDIRKFDPSPITFDDASVDDDNGVKAQLFDFTCEQNQTFMDTLNGNAMYQIPDQLSTMYITSRGYFNSTYQGYESAETYRETVSKSLGIGNNFANVSLRHTSSFRKLVLQENIEMRSFATVFALFSSTVGQLQPAWFVNLSSQTSAKLQALPDLFEKNPKAYCLFVDTYGTHYIDQAEFGGIFRASYFVDDAYFQQHTSSSSLIDDATAQFFLLAKQRGSHIQVPDNHTVSVDFKHHAMAENVYKGGEASKMTNTTGFDDWWISIAQQPALIGMQLKPISNLLAISNLKKSKSLAQAAVMYVNGGCVDVSNRS